MAGTDNSRYHVPNLERALKILELLSENPGGLTVTQITDELNISRNSVFRIAATLLDNNYIVRDEVTKVYQLSQKLLIMGYAAIGEQTLVEKSISIMRNLRDRYGETVPLGILHGTEGLIIEEIPGSFSFRFVLEPGRRFHLHTSAPGKAMVAYLPEAERESLINIIEYKRYNDRTISNPAEFRVRLEKVRKEGYALDIAEEIEGMHCAAAPIFNRHGYPIASIWITGPSMRLDAVSLEKIAVEVKKYADKISTSFGYRGNNNV